MLWKSGSSKRWLRQKSSLFEKKPFGKSSLPEKVDIAEYWFSDN